ncbi:TetR/AcrR family transcriptional regulator [Mycolicibacterium baixiangningiae]|uniref:TetR/AcrR family transcriptional regulator n=1 Tax=Mycolicibacterium baixiangningiae TaxID=2761578 RepID=UPI0018D1519C|nr:TetR/AcrR family transcriptional regulator [Mycolicibacterium baixiangningiae]
MTAPRPSRRPPVGARKGDLRERQLLDAAEAVLAERGYVQMTVNDIAAAAGITRSALYFYFGSKQDVVTALVRRTTDALQEESGAALAESGEPDAVIATALERTALLWREHGVVMRAAVDLGSTIPEIGDLWTHAAASLIEAIAGVLTRAGIQPGDGPGDAPALAAALCWMIERSFYQASKTSVDALDRAQLTCQVAWRRIALPN